MQTKKYTLPSARLKAQIKRNVLNILEKHNDADDSWLNDMYSGSLTSVAQTQEHTVCYEDVPTMPLTLFAHAPAQDTISAEETFDEDKTIKFVKRRKNTPDNPLVALLADETISVITALGPQRIFIERDGVVQQTSLRFSDEQHMMHTIQQLLQSAGQTMPAQHLVSDIPLPNGVFLTLALPPEAPCGPALTLRKYPKHSPTLHDLVRQASMSRTMADILYACVQARLNIIVCGHNGSGRTTLLNALCAAIPENERIATIEERVELRLRQPQVIALQVHDEPGAEQKRIRDLVSYAERMHASRIIVGECRSDEAPVLLQAMYNGLDGVMTTMYGHSVKDCLTRLETLCLLKSEAYSSATPKLIRSQIAQSINIVVSLSPEHKVTNIAEVQSADEGPLKIQSLFHYQEGKHFAAKDAKGSFEASGFYPEFVERCKALGISLLRDTFMP